MDFGNRRKVIPALDSVSQSQTINRRIDKHALAKKLAVDLLMKEYQKKSNQPIWVPNGDQHRIFQSNWIQTHDEGVKGKLTAIMSDME